MDQPMTDLDRVRRAALYFTMAMAVLGLAFWGLSTVSDSGVVSALGGVFSAATAVGGTVMGLLFLLARYRERDAPNRQT
jgi:membrane associated rhomboid family serine protease